jgi:putative endonuclease
MYYVYLLRGHEGSLHYIGSTSDLPRRLREHNVGYCKATRNGRPWSLLYYEAYLSLVLARRREYRLKHNGNALIELKKRITTDF